MSSEYRTRALLPDTKYERYQRASNKSRQLQGIFSEANAVIGFQVVINVGDTVPFLATE